MLRPENLMSRNGRRRRAPSRQRSRSRSRASEASVTPPPRVPTRNEFLRDIVHFYQDTHGLTLLMEDLYGSMEGEVYITLARVDGTQQVLGVAIMGPRGHKWWQLRRYAQRP